GRVIYRRLVRPFLFAFDAERAHKLGMRGLQVAGYLPGAHSLFSHCCTVEDPSLQLEVAGLRFPSPLGLAAGWDKNGVALRLIDAFGFGFAEIGSVSAQPSRGNPRPRLFRVPDEQAIVVNYGLPNDGAVTIARRIANAKCCIPLGVNLVRTNDRSRTFNEDETIADYLESVRSFREVADYLMLNLSCPNAAGGRDFFGIPGSIDRLLNEIKSLDVQCPVFLKVPPSSCVADHERWLSEVDSYDVVKGFMFNLAPGKPNWLRWNSSQDEIKKRLGAVAGRPIAEHMHECVRSLAMRMDRNRYVLFGSGGISDADDAWRQICSGASLLQLYSAFVFQGPSVAKRIQLGLLKKLEQAGLSHIQEAIGIGL
ncbi:MAG: quinone-dependent dihydroorotate dehydrogenase, partial [Planctomycetota bacterium]